MEIRNVVNEVKNDYPKMEQVSKKKLTKSVPNKWMKMGISSFVIYILMKSKSFAFSPSDIPTANQATSGGIVATPVHVRICEIACPAIQITSIIMFIITGLIILLTKIKTKNEFKFKNVKKWIRIVFIASIIAFILSMLINFFINGVYY